MFFQGIPSLSGLEEGLLKKSIKFGDLFTFDSHRLRMSLGLSIAAMLNKHPELPLECFELVTAIGLATFRCRMLDEDVACPPHCILIWSRRHVMASTNSKRRSAGVLSTRRPRLPLRSAWSRGD